MPSMYFALLRSPSSRRAWIEILEGGFLHESHWSPSSRRAWIEIHSPFAARTALRVALLAEGVDRNLDRGDDAILGELSPSSRRAWIEISQICPALSMMFVALLAEGVDRNPVLRSVCLLRPVALLAEGVDRNFATVGLPLLKMGRPPRGGRG